MHKHISRIYSLNVYPSKQIVIQVHKHEQMDCSLTYMNPYIHACMYACIHAALHTLCIFSAPHIPPRLPTYLASCLAACLQLPASLPSGIRIRKGVAALVTTVLGNGPGGLDSVRKSRPNSEQSTSGQALATMHFCSEIRCLGNV